MSRACGAWGLHVSISIRTFMYDCPYSHVRTLSSAIERHVMADDKQDARRRLIEAAAYELLVEKGYRATSMLTIAKRASASNSDTLPMVRQQAGFDPRTRGRECPRCARVARDECDDRCRRLATLRKVGPLLLGVVTGQKAVILNRAAVSDINETATLGATIAASGRETIRPLIQSLLARARTAGTLAFDDADDPTGDLSQPAHRRSADPTGDRRA